MASPTQQDVITRIDGMERELRSLRLRPVDAASGFSKLSYGGGNGSGDGGDSTVLDNFIGSLGAVQGDREVTLSAGSNSNLLIPASAEGTWDLWVFYINQLITAEAADLVGLTSVIMISQVLGGSEKHQVTVDPVFGVKWQRDVYMTYPSTEGAGLEFNVGSIVRGFDETDYYHHSYNLNVNAFYIGTLDSSFSS